MKELSHAFDCAVLHDPTRETGLCDCGALVDYAQALEKLSEVVEDVCGQGYQRCLGSGKIKDALMRVKSLIKK